MFQYLCTALYHRDSEQALKWDDPDLGIDWGVDAPEISPKDAEAPSLRASVRHLLSEAFPGAGFIYPGSVLKPCQRCGDFE